MTMTDHAPTVPNDDGFYNAGSPEEFRERFHKAIMAKGLRDEAALLRTLLQEAHREGDKDMILRATRALARVEEIDARISKLRQPQDEAHAHNMQTLMTLARLTLHRGDEPWLQEDFPAAARADRELLPENLDPDHTDDEEEEEDPQW